jgi:hypothetical protein
MKNVHIQYQDGKPVTVNTYIAEYGFKKLEGYNVEPFTRDDIAEFEQYKGLLKLDVFVGGTQTLLNVIDILGVKRPKTYNPHIYLKKFCNREIFDTTIKDIKDYFKTEYKPIFIKPAEDTKLFDGFVAKSNLDFVKLHHLEEDVKILVSEVIKIRAEYRCFIHMRNLVDMKHYAGDFTVLPDFEIIRKAIWNFKGQPIAYTLDFAVTESGETSLIEINDCYSLGYCGIHPSIYCKMLEGRWQEIMRGNE